jgi:hypothetical protein
VCHGASRWTPAGAVVSDEVTLNLKVEAGTEKPEGAEISPSNSRLGLRKDRGLEAVASRPRSVFGDASAAEG